MPSIEYDTLYLREALKSLESYLLSSDLFWNLSANPPPGEPAFPALTLGGVLLAQSRVKARNLDLHAFSEFQTLNTQLEVLHIRWRTAWEQKGLRSFKSRLNQWGLFLEDYRNQPDANQDRYPYEVRLRLILDLLIASINDIPSEQEQLLRSQDLLLKNYLVGDAFVWEEIFQAGYPRLQYWYLYGRLS